jgi:RimJ/RimL family protein N-acetyltransferase
MEIKHMGITIARATPDDAEDMLDYLRIIGSETDNLTFGKEGLPFSLQEQREYIDGIANSDRSVLLLAKINGIIVGDASFRSGNRERLKHRGELGITVIQSEWNHSIGSLLMERILAFARDTAKADIISLEVRSDNVSAIHLYQKFGFEKIGCFKGFLKINNQLVDFDLMNLYF